MSDRANEVVAACKQLPTIPVVALEVLRLSRDENVDLRQIADVMSRDVALSSRILSVTNSAFYGLPRKVSTLSQAVVMLGLASVKTLALGFSLADKISKSGAKALGLQWFWRRSLYAAVAARTFAEKQMPILREEAFIAGLLAEVGVLAMGEAFGQAYEPYWMAENRNHVGRVDQERQQFGTDHVEVGSCMAATWHLPELLTIPLAHHHDVEGCGDVDAMVAGLVGIVYTANLCAETFCGERTPQVLESFEKAAEKHLGIGQEACREMVEHLHQDASEVAQVLDLRIPESMSYSQIVQQANEELARLMLTTQMRAQKVEADHRRVVSRVQELEETNRLLAKNANCDPLTGVYNRRFMEGFLEREIARGQRFNRALSVLFIDVDHFKEVNDDHGHQVGDVVLQQIAQLLKAATREVDCLCRYGGEEFMLTLLETDLLGAKQVAEKVRRLIAAWKFRCPGVEGELHLTASIGVATLNPSRPIDKDLLIQMADESVYAAKREGRNCVCAFRKRVTPEATEAVS